jgi:hypothetical protein
MGRLSLAEINPEIEPKIALKIMVTKVISISLIPKYEI